MSEIHRNESLFIREFRGLHASPSNNPPTYCTQAQMCLQPVLGTNVQTPRKARITTEKPPRFCGEQTVASI